MKPVYHWHIHIRDAAIGYEPAKHPRGARGHFQKGGGSDPEEAPDPAHHKLPISTGGPQADRKRRKAARDKLKFRRRHSDAGICDGTSQCTCRGTCRH